MRHPLWTLLAGSAIALALTVAASAEPIKLKLAFFSSDRTNVYEAAIKPFVEAFNDEAKGLAEVEVYFSGALGKAQQQQAQLVLDGVADIAFVVPGMTPDRFRDNAVIELPGLFRNLREATLTYTRLVSANVIAGYEDFFVIGAYGSDLESIHTRPAVSSLGDLNGKKIRANNSTEAAALTKLGMVPVVLPVNAISEKISKGDIDGAAVPPSMLFEFGIARVATYHYFLRISAAPLALLMNRKSFEALPAQVQQIVRKHSGEEAAARYIANREALENQVMAQLKADARRKVIFPTQSDLDIADTTFTAVTEQAIADNPRLGKQLKAARAEIAKLRASE
jgi:TRAP-type C4-dicarboxylate transport system substrate-binding protein